MNKKLVMLDCTPKIGYALYQPTPPTRLEGILCLLGAPLFLDEEDRDFITWLKQLVYLSIFCRVTRAVIQKEILSQELIERLQSYYRPSSMADRVLSSIDEGRVTVSVQNKTMVS